MACLRANTYYFVPWASHNSYFRKLENSKLPTYRRNGHLEIIFNTFVLFFFERSHHLYLPHSFFSTFCFFLIFQLHAEKEHFVTKLTQNDSNALLWSILLTFKTAKRINNKHESTNNLTWFIYHVTETSVIYNYNSFVTKIDLYPRTHKLPTNPTVLLGGG